MLAPWKKRYDTPRQHIKKQRHHLADKCQYSQSYGFSISHIWMWELDHKESWVQKNWCFWIVMLEKKTLLDSKEIKPVCPKGSQSWIFTGRTDAEAPTFWPPDTKSWLTRKDSNAGKDWRQGEKGGSRGRGYIIMTVSHWCTEVHLVKAMVFPVVMYGYENWTIKKAEHWKIDASELWCWRKLLRVPWIARRSNQSILKEIGKRRVGKECRC